jgi:hypothetical protein
MRMKDDSARSEFEHDAVSPVTRRVAILRAHDAASTSAVALTADLGRSLPFTRRMTRMIGVDSDRYQSQGDPDARALAEWRIHPESR